MRDLPANHDLTHFYSAISHIPKYRRVVAIDAGAHVGIWTRAMSVNFQTVHAFEPQIDNFRRLGAHCPSNVFCYRLALGAASGDMYLCPGKENTGEWHISGQGEDGGQRVILGSLDSMRFLSRVDFLKIDVEGYEYFVLKGAERLVKAFKPWILLEDKFLDQKYSIEAGSALKLLESWGASEIAVYNKDHLFAFESR